MNESSDLKLSNVSVELNNRNILSKVSALFPSGRISVLIGPNGAGKSTMLKVLAGILPLSSGQFHGRGANQREHSKICAWLPPATQVAFNFSAFEIVRMGLYPWHAGSPSRQDDEAAMASLFRVCAHELARRKVGELSSGERQRVMLARALVGPSRFLLLDEPLINLDLQTSFMILDLLKEKAEEGLGIVISLHDLGLAAELTDHFICLQKGQVVASGHLGQALSEGIAERVFGVRASQLGGKWFISGLNK